MAKKICVVGAGRWGKNHIKTLYNLKVLAGIVESSEDRRAELAKEFPSIALFSTVRDAVSESFDGFTVATPAETHFEIAEFLLKKKQHVLVEKPISLYAAQARELSRLARANECRLMVGHVLLFHPAIQKIKELVDSDKIGKLQYLYSNRLNLGTVRTEENILWSFAPHDLSIFQHFIGERPERVVSRGGAWVQPHIHDSTMTVLEYPGNVKAHIFVSWLHPFKEHRLVIIGSKGMLSYEDSSETKDILFYEKGIDWVQGEPIKRDGPTEVIAYERDMPLTRELQYFVDSIDSGTVEIADDTNAIEVLEILEEASRSLLDQEPDDKGLRIVEGGKQDYFVHPSSFVGEEVSIGTGTKVWHFSHVQTGAHIGSGCTLGQNVYVGSNVRIGNKVKIQNNVSVYEGVELEDYVFCGPSMVFTNVMDPRCKYPQRGSEFYLKTLVKEGASIGANATIVCGTTIGRHAFIGAGAVVTRDVPDYALMTGVPATIAGWACECGERLSGTGKDVSCGRCGARYDISKDSCQCKSQSEDVVPEAKA